MNEKEKFALLDRVESLIKKGSNVHEAAKTEDLTRQQFYQLRSWAKKRRAKNSKKGKSATRKPSTKQPKTETNQEIEISGFDFIISNDNERFHIDIDEGVTLSVAAGKQVKFSKNPESGALLFQAI